MSLKGPLTLSVWESLSPRGALWLSLGEGEENGGGGGGKGGVDMLVCKPCC